MEVKMKKYVLIPKELMEKAPYKNLSGGAKVLYGILSAMKEEAVSRDWVDPRGARYVVFPKKMMQKELDCSRYWIDIFVKELETLDLIKLGYLYKPIIERRIYVRSFGEDVPGIRVEYGTEESDPGEVTSPAPDNRETKDFGESKGSEAETGEDKAGGPDAAPIPEKCSLKDADVKELLLVLLTVMTEMSCQLFGKANEKA